jgi:hypothetical protein
MMYNKIVRWFATHLPSTAITPMMTELPADQGSLVPEKTRRAGMNVNRGKVPLWITLLTFVGLAAAVALWITSADPPRAMAQDEMPTLVTAPRPDVLASEAQAYPPDPPHDIPWDINANALTVDDVRTVFNRARAAENAALGTFLGEINLPTMAVWRTMDDGARALWLINEERTARNLPRLHGIEQNVTAVAQAFADWLLAHNAWGHDADGRTPKQRLYANPTINACHDELGVAENLSSASTSSADGIALPLERAIFGWLYDDAKHGWLHRHAILWTPYAENSGPADREGFLGIGHAHGSYMGYPQSDMIVMNVFDPCATWTYTAPPAPPTPTATPQPTPRPAPTVAVPPAPAAPRTVAGQSRQPVWQVIESQPFEVGTWPGQWQVSDANGAANGEYMWVAAPCRVFAGTFSGMAVGGGADGMQTACNANYPNNARSWMIYGPFSLADAVAAEVEIKAWVHTASENDELCVAASTNRVNFGGACFSGTSGAWVSERLDLNRVVDLGSLLGRSTVYVALAFLTDGSGNLPHQGAYADNVIIRKATLASAVESSQAAASVSGVDAVIIRDEAGHQTMTDQSGSFLLEGLTPGKHTLTPVKAGFQFYPPFITVDLSKGNAVDVAFVGTTSLRLGLFLPYVARE